jgi:hypothetical protein
MISFYIFYISYFEQQLLLDLPTDLGLFNLHTRNYNTKFKKLLSIMIAKQLPVFLDRLVNYKSYLFISSLLGKFQGFILLINIYLHLKLTHQVTHILSLLCSQR